MLTLKQADVGASEELVNDQQHQGLCVKTRLGCKQD